VGASFAGLFLAKKLIKLLNAKPNDSVVEIVIIDRNDYFEFICSMPNCIMEPEIISELSITYKEVIRNIQARITHPERLSVRF
jgi:NADH dehydrogenase FAD-containing subunit